VRFRQPDVDDLWRHLRKAYALTAEHVDDGLHGEDRHDRHRNERNQAPDRGSGAKPGDDPVQLAVPSALSVRFGRDFGRA
jgi:hypothetical protein